MSGSQPEISLKAFMERVERQLGSMGWTPLGHSYLLNLDEKVVLTALYEAGLTVPRATKVMDCFLSTSS